MVARKDIPTDLLLRLGLVALLIVGAWRVLAPFFPALLFSTVLAVSTWPAYVRLADRLHRFPRLASVSACVLMAVIAAGPSALLLLSFGDGVRWFVEFSSRWLDGGLPPLPDWLRRMPLLGEHLAGWWRDAGDGGSLAGELLAYLAAPARDLAMRSGKYLSNALLQISLVVLLLYFFYRNGARLGRQAVAAAARLGGDFGVHLLETAKRSVVGVMYSIVGAGLAQALVATAGFAIAGVPNPFLLGSLTFVLSLVALGPPLLWLGVAVWLLQAGEPGRAIFMVFYGALAISSVDNLLKPLIISHASRLPFVATLMGVIGGLLAFGVMGVFLGPAVLALAIDLSAHWLKAEARSTTSADPPDAA